MEILLAIVSLLSLTLAVAMSAVVWRLVREERRRTEARVAALRAEIRRGAVPAEIAAAAALDLGSESTALSGAPLFADAEGGRRFPGRLGAVAAAGALVVGSAVTIAVALGGHHAAGGAAARDHSAARSSEPVPLELVALGHERDADGLVVRGVVRNPVTGRTMSRLTAVVLLFDRNGAFVTSGRAPVETSLLAPGTESPFVVPVAGAADVNRYRVSFQTDDRPVPHVDCRVQGEPPAPLK